jgi:hypothetical protein
MEMEAFLARCERYCSAKGMSRARLSTIVFGSGVTIDRLRNGAGVTVRVLNRASERLTLREASLGTERGAAPAAA